MAVLKHVHQYQLYKSKSGRTLREKTFRCADPLCTHFAEAEVVIGKLSRCNSCGNEFLLDAEAARRVRPKCILCSETKKGKAYQAAKSLMTSLMPPEKDDDFFNVRQDD